jgi:hypothetical protein
MESKPVEEEKDEPPPAEVDATEPVQDEVKTAEESKAAAEPSAPAEPGKPVEAPAAEAAKPAEASASASAPEPEKAAEETEETTAPEPEKEGALSKAKEAVKVAVEEVKDAVKPDQEVEAPKEAPPPAEESQKDTVMVDASQTAPPNGTSQDVDMADVPAAAAETQATTESQTGDKRKLDKADVNGSNSQDVAGASEPAEKKAKVADATPEKAAAAALANGGPVGRKVSKRRKKDLATEASVGRTQRRTRSQGLADAP